MTDPDDLDEHVRELIGDALADLVRDPIAQPKQQSALGLQLDKLFGELSHTRELVEAQIRSSGDLLAQRMDQLGHDIHRQATDISENSAKLEAQEQRLRLVEKNNNRAIGTIAGILGVVALVAVTIAWVLART